ncbi:NfeD family protein [Oceanisphaera sp. IT1-181]|uniref:NfeD family protein n=1 Tax=Oceanisphaera sp. IT1-181 TaxID=3081199 RepID=UPI0029C9CF69|nr:NfeD family protein [Oceanisphaera sp. IT1-181]
MLAWHAWLIAALLLLLLELLSLGFFALALGLAALVAMSAALLGQGVTVQLFVFALAAGLLAPGLKWLFRRYAPSRRTSFLAGEGQRQEGEITQLETGEYRLRFEGDLFMVRSASNAPLIVGARVKICRFDGITAIID